MEKNGKGVNNLSGRQGTEGKLGSASAKGVEDFLVEGMSILERQNRKTRCTAKKLDKCHIKITEEIKRQSYAYETPTRGGRLKKVTSGGVEKNLGGKSLSQKIMRVGSGESHPKAITTELANWNLL